MSKRSLVLKLALAAALAVAGGATRAQAPDCSRTQTESCLYVPAASFGFTRFQRPVTYTDITGAQRTVQVMMRVPSGAATPLPVVIWSHGGAEGKDGAAKSLPEWGAVTATAGYLSVNIAHPARADWRPLCSALGITLDDACRNFKQLNWDRPHDIHAVIETLRQLNDAGEFAGAIDMARIAVAGHSAGSGGALSVAGARRIFVGTPQDLSDPRPVAFLAFSPQEPGSEGFFDTDFRRPEHSWSLIERPVLVATGDGDSTCQPGIEPGSCVGDTPFGRRIGFARMPAGDKYQLYLADTDAFHELFALNTEGCVRKSIGQAKCDEMMRWLASAALAFLDGHVRAIPAALQWLQSDRIHGASGGVAEWLRR